MDIAAARLHLAEQSRRLFGEEVLVTPGIMGDERWQADPSRPAFAAIVHPLFSPGDDSPLAGSKGGAWMARIAVGPAAVEVDFVACPDAISARRKDRVMLTQRGETFEIDRVDRQGRDRLVWSLVRI